MQQTKEKRMYMRIRNICGFLGAILPWLAILSAGLAQHPSSEWWWSISCTYYQSPALVGVLTPACIVLLCYIGYDKWDNIVTSLSGLCGLGIILFPCQVSWIAPGQPVGFFQLPMEVSHIFHTIFAALFFLLLSINSICLFTKSGGDMTPRKRMRNAIYRFCGWAMISFEVIFVLVKLLHSPGYMTMVVEIILLTLFGLSWLVKGEAFPFLNDEE
ncbi:MAG: hypothetical protein MJZ86_05175 [Bacteroidales bacterium]|nr:hypothetical protein [Bacteroidales bacterium]